MEALTISQANLNAIAQNMESVAKELNGVITHINEVNSKVNSVEDKVSGINGEISDVVEEIRANTIINNARQSIIYNNNIIEKKFGYYDLLRRNVESLVENLENKTLNVESIDKLKNSITMNNPRYWLANATLSIIYWLLDDRVDSENELKLALNKNQEKTSLLLMMLYLDLGQKETALHWLRYYLNHQDPMNIKDEFITILDLVSSGYLGIEGEKILIDKISEWIKKISNNLKDTQTNKWVDYINSNKRNEAVFKYISDYAVNKGVINNNFSIFSAFHQMDNMLENILKLEKEDKNVDKVIYNLIYDYEESEKTYQLDNLRNELLIQTNGNKAEAEKLFEKQSKAYVEKTDILNLFFNIINQTDKYNIGANSIKTALVFQKEYIQKALDIVSKNIKETEINFHIDDVYASTKDGLNIDKVKKDIETTAESKYADDDKTLIILPLIINIVGLVAVLLASNNSIFSILALIIILVVNFVIIIKLNKRSRLRDEQKKSYIDNILSIFEKNFAECTDYNNIIQKEKEFLNNIIRKLQELKLENVIVLKERNINISR